MLGLPGRVGEPVGLGHLKKEPSVWMHQRLKEGPMEREPVPSAIVARLLEAAKELEEWAVEHRQATLAEHEKGVLRIFRRVMGPALGAVPERALGLDHPAAQRQRAACPACGVRRRPHQWRNRQPVSVCGETPFQRPYYWCAACQRGWVPADEVLGLGPHQILSAELEAWVAATGAELPFQQAAEQLERLAGIGLGIETVRTHTEQVGTALAERQHAAATAVAQTQEAAEPVELAPELLVAEVDGVLVRFQDGWHEAKVGEIAGCRVGNGLPDTDPLARPPVLVAPSYVASRAPVGEFGPLFLAEAARRGVLEVVDWTQPKDTDPRLRLVGPAEAQLRSVVVLGDGAHWIWELAAEQFAAQRIEIVDYWHVTEHVWTVGRALFGEDPDAAGAWAEAWCVDLLEHGPEPWLAALRSADPPDAAAAEVLRVELGYFTTNAPRMDYPAFQSGGLPIGSGAVESAAKHVVQVRMKRSGMRWSDSGGEAMLALCAYRASNRPLPIPDALPSAA